MTRRANGEGSVFADAGLNHGRGGYRARLTLPDGSRWTATATLRRDVIAKLDQKKRDMARGATTTDTDRVEPFLRWWLDSLEANVSTGKSINSIDNARWAVERWIVPTLGKKKLARLRAEDIEAMLSAMADAGRAHRTIRLVRMYLAQALDVAQKRGMMTPGWNPARVAEMPKTAASTPRRAMTSAQAHEFLKAAAGDRLEALYITGFLLGLRPGELRGLRWQDIDFKHGTLTIQHSMKLERGEARLGDTKTSRNSSRVVSMPAMLTDALRAHRKVQAKERLAAENWTDTDLVFATPTGGPLDPANLRRDFRELTEKAGLGRWTTYELRHSAASLLADAGVPLHEIADLLGQNSIKMLEQHYRHQLRPSVDAHVGTMDRLFGRVT